MTKTKPGKLLGSAGSLEALKALIKEKFYWSTVIVEKISDNGYSVASSKGIAEGFQIRVFKNRYRLELI